MYDPVQHCIGSRLQSFAAKPFRQLNILPAVTSLPPLHSQLCIALTYSRESFCNFLRFQKLHNIHKGAPGPDGR